MRVVWAYRAYLNENGEPGTFQIGQSESQLYFYYASLVSWSKFAPTVSRVAYFDEYTYNFLRRECPVILDFLNKIEIVDFSEVLDNRYSSNFFANPKLWAYTQQEEPFFICDTDVILLKNLDSWFDSNKYYSFPYNMLDHDNVSKDTSLDDYLGLIKDSRETPGLRNLCNISNSVNGCLLYFPDPRVGQIVGYTTLALQAEICNRSDRFSWNLYEEGVIRNITEIVSKECSSNIPSHVFVEYPNTGTMESVRKELEHIKQNVGLDLVEPEKILCRNFI